MPWEEEEEDERQQEEEEEEEEGGHRGTRKRPRLRTGLFAGFSTTQHAGRVEAVRQLQGKLPDVPRPVISPAERALFDLFAGTNIGTNYGVMCDQWNNHVRTLVVGRLRPRDRNDPAYIGCKTVRYLSDHAKALDLRRRNEEGRVVDGDLGDDDDDDDDDDGNQGGDGGSGSGAMYDGDRAREAREARERQRGQQRRQREIEMEARSQQDMEARRNLRQQLSSSANVPMPSNLLVREPQRPPQAEMDILQREVIASLPPPVPAIGAMALAALHQAQQREPNKCQNCGSLKSGHPRTCPHPPRKG